MAKQTINNIKLGFFVGVGLLILVFSLYIIGKKKSFWGSSFEVKARFNNVNGLMKGNNVRFSGIQAGTVKDISILNDSTIEVTLLISDDIKAYIHKNSTASIGSEGLMGNKIINIEPNNIAAPTVEEGDVLIAAHGPEMDDMLQTLDQTNRNVALISEDLKITIRRINNSKTLWNILEDSSLAKNLKISLANIGKASYEMNDMVTALNAIVHDVNNGGGVAGVLLKDSIASRNVKATLVGLSKISHQIDTTLEKLNTVVDQVHTGITDTNGTINAMLTDTAMAKNLRTSLYNIEKGTASFSEDMEALKHNFLFRKYFKKQAKKSSRK